MKAVLDHGIILRVRPFRDTSVMVHWFTESNGRVATAVRGARGPKSSYRGKLDLFIEADISLRWREGAEVQGLGEVVVTAHHASLRTELGSLAVLAHAVATLEQVTEPSTPQPETYADFLGLVRHLERHGPRPRALFGWELRFLETQGLGLSARDLTGGDDAGVDALLEALRAPDWEDLHVLKASTEAVRKLDRGLQAAWTRHFGRIPKTRAPALEWIRVGTRSPSAPEATSASDGSPTVR